MYFYEQDVVMIDYTYSGDIKITTDIDYRYPGIGIVIAEKKDETPENSNNVFVFKIGTNDFTVINRKLLTLSKVFHASCPFAPLDVSQIRIIDFHKDGLNISFTTIIDKKEVVLGTYVLPEPLDEYRIGFYSNQGNTVQKAVVYSDRPQYWFSNTRNTNGGRLSFKKDTFTIEQAELPIEVEHENIELTKGMYFLDFERAVINGKKNIKCYVFDSTEKRIDAKRKNLLQADNSFVIPQDMKVNILFQGTSGEISKICIKDDDRQSYVSTGDFTEEKPGSRIIIHLAGLKRVQWIGTVDLHPDYSLNEELPYSIVEYNKVKKTVEDLQLSAGISYKYDFKLSDDNTYWELIITNVGTTENIISTCIFKNIDTSMKLFDNISGSITELIVTTINGDEINVLLQKTYKKYVPITIEGPILVVDESDVPFDLSSSYRYVKDKDEFIFTNWEREIFKPTEQIILTNKVNDGIDSIIVYGIKDENYDMTKIYDINSSEPVTSINQFSTDYDAISTDLYKITDFRVIDFDNTLAAKYKVVVIDYLKEDSYCINLTDDRKQYEVDISSNKEKIETLYDMTADGQVRKYKILDDIVPADDQYIVLKKDEIIA